MSGQAIALKSFEDLNRAADVAAYVAALRTFDELKELRELKALARRQVRPGDRVLDIGCGFGLETFRLARHAGPTGHVTGVDRSAAFIAEATRRAKRSAYRPEFREGDAERLPFADAAFDVARAERLLIYLPDPAETLREMYRVTRAGGHIALIEPDFDTNAVNVSDRGLARKVLAHEADHGVAQGLLVRDLRNMLGDLGFADIRIATRLVIFEPDLAAAYFGHLGVAARQAGAISEEEAAAWTSAIAGRHAAGRLFASIGYYLVTATRP